MGGILIWLARIPGWVRYPAWMLACVLLFVLAAWGSFVYYFPSQRAADALSKLVSQHTPLVLRIHKLQLGWSSLQAEWLALEGLGRPLVLTEVRIRPGVFPPGLSLAGGLEKQGAVRLFVPLAREKKGQLTVRAQGAALSFVSALPLPQRAKVQLEGIWQLRGSFQRGTEQAAFPLAQAEVQLSGEQLQLAGVQVLGRSIPPLNLSAVVLDAILQGPRLQVRSLQTTGDAELEASGEVGVNFSQLPQSSLNLQIGLQVGEAWLKSLGALGTLLQTQLKSMGPSFALEGTAAAPQLKKQKAAPRQGQR